MLRLGEALYLYLGVVEEEVSVVVVQKDGGKQKLVYFNNRVLYWAKLRYQPLGENNSSSSHCSM